MATWGPGVSHPATIKFVRTDMRATLPKKAHADDACFDLFAAGDEEVWPGASAVIDTGFRVAIPRGYVGLVCSRSGLAAKEGLFVLNAPGVVDEGYRGNLKVIVHNTGTRPFEVESGDRIGQLLLQKTVDCRAMEVTEFRDTVSTSRGEGGLGSTGR